MVQSFQTTQWALMPALRAELVKELKKLGLRQKRIAHMMGLTPAAVSQYLNGKRGNTEQFAPEISKMISLTAKKMNRLKISEDDLFREIFELVISVHKLNTMKVANSI
jgi:uncharacterized protein